NIGYRDVSLKGVSTMHTQHSQPCQNGLPRGPLSPTPRLPGPVVTQRDNTEQPRGASRPRAPQPQRPCAPQPSARPIASEAPRPAASEAMRPTASEVPRPAASEAQHSAAPRLRASEPQS